MKNLLFGAIIGTGIGFVSCQWYSEYKVDKTGVLELDYKTYTCRVHKEDE